MSDFRIESEQVDVITGMDSNGQFITEAGTVDSASDGIPPGRDFLGSRRCTQCGFLFKYDDLVYFRGHYYGKPCGDYKDISSILRREAAQRELAQSKEQQRSR